MSLWRRILSILALALASGVAVAQVPLPSEGEVIRVGEQIEVDLEGATEAAIGSRILTMRAVDVGGRQVGVLTGVYRVIRVEWPNVRAVLDPERADGLPGASRGDRATVESDGDPSELAIASQPEGARILWDGHLLGMTGDTLVVAPGDYTFAFEKSDYEPAEYPFDVPIGQIRGETVSLDQAAGGDLLYESAKAKFGQCDFEATRTLTSEAIQNGLSGEALSDAFAMMRAMELAAPMAARARAQGAPEASVCDAGSAFHLWAKGERADDPEMQSLACADLRRALPDDPLVRQTCP
ncbi:MAG: PEGA domain-containing protein [Bacteroidota bacterium]